MVSGENMSGRKVSRTVSRVVIGVVTGLVATLLGMVGQGVAGQGSATAIPANAEANYVTTLNCTSTNPWPAGPVKVRVDVFNNIRFPADGLPGPVIALIGSDRAKPVALEYTYDVTVRWKNLRTGRTGKVFVPGRGFTVKWQVDIHPGHGPVAFTIHQKLGALAFNPMVNPQYSSCSGRATA
ncbi:Uncharacterised protein [Gordonia paraffinivorans]|uniref:Uncharacterized protein n=2 Tax=Gordonia paraffinivorans TaxID=175628 RepID=A0ABD7UY61_9ACTN|nr:Uncharacterised protein [Gordonia paraffinivorans]